MSNTPNRLSLGEWIAALPRVAGYTPAGRVVAALIDPAGGEFQCSATVDAHTDESAQAAAEALRRYAAGQGRSLAAVVVGWRGTGSMRADTRRLAEHLTQAGVSVLEQATTDGRRYRDLTTGDSGIVGAQSPQVAAVGPEPKATREDAVASWEPTGTITPQPAATEADGITAWQAVLDGQPSRDQIARAAWALTNRTQRDRILASLTGMDLSSHNLAEVETLAAYRDRPDLLDRLREAVTQMQPGYETALPMLTITLGVAFTRGSRETGPLASQVMLTDPHRHYTLAALLTFAVLLGADPAGLLT